MSQVRTAVGPVWQAPFELRSMTRGRRTPASIYGTDGSVWCGRLAVRAMLRLRKIFYPATPAVFSGPVWSTCRRSVPKLSWFVLPDSGSVRRSMSRAIQALIDMDEGLGASPDLPGLIARLVAARAEISRDAIPACPPELLQPLRSTRIMLIDQPRGDKTTRLAFMRMVAAARSDDPNAEFWIWPAESDAAGELARVRHLPRDASYVSPGFSFFAALSQIDRIYTVSAPEGMQALLAGVPVRVFGRPFYAGWGLTVDDLPMPERRARPTLAALFEAVYLRLAHYLDPETQGVGTLQRLLDCIELQRGVRARFADCGQLAGLRFQIWKRPFVTPFLGAGGGQLRWTDAPEQIMPGERVVVWGGKSAEGIPVGTPVLRMEDGFFHSDGLGSDMNAPQSQVLDRHGLYFDARRPSELTHILNQACFDEAELERAAALRVLACRLGVTKYNLGRSAPRWRVPANRRVLLVAGQVADDASIRFGTGAISTAEALLETVRQRNPDAFIVYKPHPDVLSGNRNGLVHAQRLADVVDADADVLSLIDRADEVHVLSSLAGFDALLRGKRVFTYGLPFYAGWGLTTDELEQPWRERSLTLDMLVAGTLLRYPVYWDWRMQMFTTPEAVVNLLGKTASRPLVRIAKDPMRWPRKIWRWSRNAVKYGIWAWQRQRGAVA
ncbi:Capsule polysaccharide export protein [Cupriavidus necator]|uniref:capsular polysaccharide biosynthesis protein n=1 Tax=Cupriavidus necator TaxID=106590 RepID=UPI003F73E124